MFTEELWDEWQRQERKNYTLKDGRKKYIKKGYSHFDHRFWFPDRINEIKKLVSNGLRQINPTSGGKEWFPFAPFLRMLIKTPRYRYQEEECYYDLECKIRPICFASHLDSLVFGFYAFCLNKTYEDYIKSKGFDKVVLAYRVDPGKCNIQYSKIAFDIIRDYCKKFKGCTAIALDIKGYFNNINHEILKKKWCTILGDDIERLPDDQYYLFKNLTAYSYVNKHSLYRKYSVDERKLKKAKAFPPTLFELIPGANVTAKYEQLRKDNLLVTNSSSVGIPQGSAMSALLSNIYLIDYDMAMMSICTENGAVYFRYCDDILIICETKNANKLSEFAIKEIKKEYGLTIQKEKQEVIDFMLNLQGQIRSFRRKKGKPDESVKLTPANEKKLYKNLQYLGFEFNGQKAFIRPSSVSRYYRKMKARLDRTVSMSYSPNGKGKKIRKFQIYERYSHLGNHNFLNYAKNAALREYQNKEKEWKEGHGSSSIQKQLARHFDILKDSLSVKNNRLYRSMLAKEKPIRKKKT